MIAGRFCFIHVAPTVVLQSCMSLHMLGTIIASDAGAHSSGTLSEAGTLVKSAHGLCFRRYSPLLPSQPVNPALGMDSAYPRNVWCAASSCVAMLGALDVSGHSSPVTPCTFPENSSR